MDRKMLFNVSSSFAVRREKIYHHSLLLVISVAKFIRKLGFLLCMKLRSGGCFAISFKQSEGKKKKLFHFVWESAQKKAFIMK